MMMITAHGMRVWRKLTAEVEGVVEGRASPPLSAANRDGVKPCLARWDPAQACLESLVFGS